MVHNGPTNYNYNYWYYKLTNTIQSTNLAKFVLLFQVYQKFNRINRYNLCKPSILRGYLLEVVQVYYKCFRHRICMYIRRALVLFHVASADVALKEHGRCSKTKGKSLHKLIMTCITIKVLGSYEKWSVTIFPIRVLLYTAKKNKRVQRW